MIRGAHRCSSKDATSKGGPPAQYAYLLCELPVRVDPFFFLPDGFLVAGQVSIHVHSSQDYGAGTC